MDKERENKVKIHRLLQIDAMIREGTYPNASQLGKKFEVSRSTIMRDLDFLRDRYNAPLEYDPVKNGFYYTDSTFFMKSVMLSEGELFTISAITPLLEQYKNTPLETSFKLMLEKISSMLPNQVSVDSAFVGNEIKFISDPLPKIEEAVFKMIFQAIATKKSVEFGYRSISRQEYENRVLDPYHVICQKGNWYVIGFCHDKSEIRVYSMSRMKNIVLMSESFVIPEDFYVEKYIDSSFGVWNNSEEPVKIELLFDKTVNTYILERSWHETQEMYQNENGTVYLSFRSNQIQETLYWILHFGSAVKVLNPPELAEKVRQEARKIIEKYDI